MFDPDQAISVINPQDVDHTVGSVRHCWVQTLHQLNESVDNLVLASL